MKKITLLKNFVSGFSFLLAFVISQNVHSQVDPCNGNTFSNPGQPETCTYTYTASGWIDASENPISAPVDTDDTESICILADNTDNFGQIKGSFFIQEGVTYKGSVDKFIGAIVIVEGRAEFSNAPDVDSGTKFIIDVSGYASFEGDKVLNGDATIDNAGTFLVNGSLQTAGQTLVNNYPGGTLSVTGNTEFENTFNNCGLLEIGSGSTGNLTVTGGGNLLNFCTIYVHNDIILKSDFTNDVLLIIDGNINLDGADLYNNGKLLVNNFVLNNDDIIGDYENSMLFVRNNAELYSGATVTGHYLYDISDPTDGSPGFDSICDTCTADVDIINDAVVPNPLTDLETNCGDSIIINPVAEVSSIDFDGINDYAEQLNVKTDNTLDPDTIIEGLASYTLSFWFKYQGDMITNTDEVFVMGQEGVLEAFITDDETDTEEKYQKINARLHTSAGPLETAGMRFDPNSWTHLTITVSNSEFRIFKNGIPSETLSFSGSINSNTNTFKVAEASSLIASFKRFTGWMEEVRLFDTVLTQEQINQLICQEIENNSGNVRGTVIPKDIEDSALGTKIPWSSLQAYYPMTEVISYSRTDDFSSNSNALKLYNIETFQPQTAPMPYETKAGGDGNWSSADNWLHGNVWDIETLDTEYAASDEIPGLWSIIKVKHDLATSGSRGSMGLFIDPSVTLSTVGDVGIQNNWYLELNGTMDLADDSQLIQTENSDLVTGAAGEILRRQEGTNRVHWYNYWSSPVGSLASTSLTDNNTDSNNTNNTPFSISMLKDGDGNAIQFTSAYDQLGKVSTYWLYSFQNGVTYYDWDSLTINSQIDPGVGYTQKGTGISNPDNEQQYIFQGKPNNGTILIVADDVDGDNLNESEQNVTLTTTLIGNPYPSALDAIQFIDDNIPGTGTGTTNGTILLWEQWAGNSHNLAAYQGGYGYINKLATERAYQHEDIALYGQVSSDGEGIKRPTNYIPVGQGFFVEVINDGVIKFENDQRVFIKESDVLLDQNDPDYANNGSAFFRTNSSNQESSSAENVVAEDQILRLEFGVSSGASRSFVIGFREDATEGLDYGLDGGLITNPPADDMGSLINGQQYVIQALPPFTSETEVDLVLHASGNFTYTLRSTELTNFPAEQDLYLKDNYTGMYYDLRSTYPYDFSSDAGTFTDRFQVVFNDGTTLSDEDFITDSTLIYINNIENKLYVKNLIDNAKQLNITNMIGQNIKSIVNINNQTLENGIDVSNLSNGVYIVNIKTDGNTQISKKVILE